MHGTSEEWSLESLAEALQRFGCKHGITVERIEFVIGRLTEFNYQSSKDGTTVTMEYFTQEQVDAQVWANSK